MKILSLMLFLYYASLANSEITRTQRVALIEFSDVSYLKEWKPSPNEFSNRVSALTPRSVEFFKGNCLSSLSKKKKKNLKRIWCNSYEFFIDIGAWENIVSERVTPFNDMQVWDGITDARITFNCKGDSRTNLENIAWIVENHNIQQAILTRLSQQCKDFNFQFFENTKVEGISLNDSSVSGVNERFDLSEWPNVKLNDGSFLKARLLVSII